MSRSIRRFPLAALTALVLAATSLAGCASSGDEEGAPTETIVQPWVSADALANELALRASVQATHVALEASDGTKILLFPGTKLASVAGVTLDLRESVAGKGLEASLSPADASSVRVTWRGRAPSVAPGYGSPGPTQIVLPPLPPRPTATSPRPAPTASASSDNEPTGVELKAWSVPLKRRWRYIILHHSASAIGSASQIHQWHKDKGWDGLGYDFVIGNGTGSGDGVVEVGYRWKQQLTGAHAQVPGPSNWANEQGIGICLVGDFNRTRPSERQMRALERLCAFLATYCDIPVANLQMHHDVKSTDCPGRLFPKDFAFQPLQPSAIRTAFGEPAPGTPQVR